MDSEHARDLILVSNPMCLVMGNHLEPFSGASDASEGQEQGGGAVGGQRQLMSEIVTLVLNMLET